MADSNHQDNPPLQKDPVGTDPRSETPVGRAADHTSVAAQNKGSVQKAPAEKNATLRALRDMTHKLKTGNQLLEDKERMMIAYVTERFPKPFYVNWRDEANAAFTLVVDMRRRQRRARARLQGER